MLFLNDYPEGRYHLNNHLQSDKQRLFLRKTREPQERSLCYQMIALASADKLTAIDAACNTATRIANRCFATTNPLTAPTAPPEAGRRTDDSAAVAYRPNVPTATELVALPPTRPSTLTEVRTSNAAMRVS